MKRVFDVACSVAALVVLLCPMIIVGLAIRLTSKGPAIHWSKRVGKDNRIFPMAKFRTMRMDAPQVATHLLKDPVQHITPIGKFLRKYSLDELPQLYNILMGDLSIVGPRPALFNQDDLIALRTNKGIHRVMPGLTGWAQVNGRDDLSISNKVVLDEYYFHHRSFLLDLRIIFLTARNSVQGTGVSH